MTLKCKVTMATQRQKEKQGQKDGYLLRELWVVERGLKNASGEDCERNTDTREGWKCP